MVERHSLAACPEAFFAWTDSEVRIRAAVSVAGSHRKPG